MVRILLVDDHEIVRSGLQSFIHTLLSDAVIDDAWDGDTALGKINESEYHLIIMDVNMPNTDALDLVKKITLDKPGIKILIFSMNAETDYAHRFLKAGAKGYVNKDASAKELGNAIITALKNEQHLIPLFEEEEETNNPFDSLSKREFEIVHYLIEGQSLSDIRSRLDIKASTLSTFKKRIFEKLGCKNVIEIIPLARIHNF
jgi:two-component system invasion response regulator UvrY